MGKSEYGALTYPIAYLVAWLPLASASPYRISRTTAPLPSPAASTACLLARHQLHGAPVPTHLAAVRRPTCRHHRRPVLQGPGTPQTGSTDRTEHDVLDIQSCSFLSTSIRQYKVGNSFQSRTIAIFVSFSRLPWAESPCFQSTVAPESILGNSM